MRRTVVINRAVPGSGKSTIADCIVEALQSKNSAASIHSTDAYFVKNSQKYDFDAKQLADFHAQNLEAFTNDLKEMIDLVVCDNTNLSSWQSEPYTNAARKHGYQVVFIDFPPRLLEKHILAQKVTKEKPDAHDVPEKDILDKVAEYHQHKNLLDKSIPRTSKNCREIWDNEILDVRLTDELLPYYDLDFLITIQPDEYHAAKANIGNRVFHIMSYGKEDAKHV